MLEGQRWVGCKQWQQSDMVRETAGAGLVRRQYCTSRGGITQAMLGHGALRRTTGRAVTHLARRCVSSETKLTTLPNQARFPP